MARDPGGARRQPDAFARANGDGGASRLMSSGCSPAEAATVSAAVRVAVDASDVNAAISRCSGPRRPVPIRLSVTRMRRGSPNGKLGRHVGEGTSTDGFADFIDELSDATTAVLDNGQCHA
jgi:hypothetical protein